MSPRKPTGRPRGRPPAEEPLAAPIYVRLSEGEHVQVAQRAEAAGLKLSAWVRSAVQAALRVRGRTPRDEGE